MKSRQKRGVFLGLAAMLLGTAAVAQPSGEPPKDAQPAQTQPAAARPAPKAAADLWSFPQGTIAYWAVSPKLPASSEADPTRTLVERGLLSLLAHAVRLDGGGTAIIENVLDPAVLKGRSYRLCLLDFAGSPSLARGAGEPGFVPDQLLGVLEIRSGAEHDRLIAAVQRALEADERARKAAGGVARPLRLPGGAAGIAYSRAGEDSWREVSWCSTESSFLIGFGPGALERWVLAEAGRDPVTCEWVMHRANTTRKRSGGESLFEAFIDLNALRRGVPELFAAGDLGELARAWNVSNARTLMLLGRSFAAGQDKGRLLGIEAAWSSRAERPGLGRTMAIAEGALQQGAAAPAKDAWAMALKPEWSAFVTMAGDTYRALCGPRASTEFGVARQRYLTRRGAALQRVLTRLGERAMIEPAGADGVIVRIPLREARPDPNAKTPALEADLREIFALPEISYDGAGKSWSLRLKAPDASGAALFPADFSWRVSKDGSTFEGRWGEWVRENAKDAPPK